MAEGDLTSEGSYPETKLDSEVRKPKVPTRYLLLLLAWIPVNYMHVLSVSDL